MPRQAGTAGGASTETQAGEAGIRRSTSWKWHGSSTAIPPAKTALNWL